MKFFLLTLALSVTIFSLAEANDIVNIELQGKQYTCTPTDEIDDNQLIALSCYEDCRKDGTSHPYCKSVCDAEGIPGVKLACYKICTKDGTSSAYCKSVCD